ncbi:MAG: hypothetical protein Q9165_007631 [Trypethelium subeluteriae]
MASFRPTDADLAAKFTEFLEDREYQNQYSEERLRLLEAEQASSWDSKARLEASDVEMEAAAIVRTIREMERDDPTLFGNQAGESIPDSETRDMGGQFLTNKNRIEQSKIYSIAREMPKGGHLHIHFNSELHPNILLQRAKDMDTMFIRSIRPLLEEDHLDETEVVFNVLQAETKSSTVFAPNYNPDHRAPNSNPWMKFKDFCIEFREKFNSDPLDWVRSKAALNEDEVYKEGQTLNGIWARFNQGTRCFKGLLNYESVFRWYISAAIDSMIEDKIMYAELRPMLMDKTIPSDDGLQQLTHSDQMNIIVEEVSKKKKDLEAQGQLELFPFGLKIIYCTPRSIPKPRMTTEMLDCIRLKLAYPDLICGFDLVGAEDRPNSISYYRDELLAFVKTCESLGIKIPFLFHAGETLLDTGGSKDPENSNLFDVVLLNSKRIGHGYSILKHPKLIEEFKKKRICIELCPVSNELLNLCRNIKQHPYPAMLQQGLECTVNSDNPALFRSSSANSSTLSYEFYQIMVGSTLMNLHGWRQLAQWSIVHSCLNENEKEEGLRYWSERWEEFCLWIVKKFGPVAKGAEV